MTTYQTALTLDFGSVGYQNSRHPFRVELDATLLSDLIADAAQAYRVYELMLIERPGDVWDYVSVKVEAAPPRVVENIRSKREELKEPLRESYPWSEDRVPFPVFDKLFYWAGDDTEPADEAWLGHRDSPVMRGYTQQLLSMVRIKQNGLNWNDHLLRHIIASFKSATHPYVFLERRAAVEKSRSGKPAKPAHTESFYKKLREILRDAELVSVAYRADGDYQVLRQLATEQRRRAGRTGHTPGHALHISAIVNRRTDNVAWDSEIWFFDEGLGHGDLFIQGHGMVGGAGIGELIEVHRRPAPGRYIFSVRDEGDVAGYEKESGDGWVLYTKLQPSDRREGLQRIGSRRSAGLGPVLKFAEKGQGIFDFDKTLVVVGEAVGQDARTALIAAMLEWESKGGDPVIAVLGDLGAFLDAGCRRVFGLPESYKTAEAREKWLSELISIELPWADVFLALEVPEWVAGELAWKAQQQESPWLPWVVYSGELAGIDGAVRIEGELAVTLRNAHLRAKAGRPQVL